MPEAKWYHSRGMVFLMLFVVLGPFGLPLLWKSPHFTKGWKHILTALTLLYTLWVLQSLYSAITTSMRSLNSMGLGL